jgi:cytochrome c oxidase cbb3-type subunit III
MLNWKSAALSLTLVLTPALYMIAQEPAFTPGGRGAADKGDKGIPAAIAGSKEDPAAFDRGAKAYTQFCAGCHGATGRGSVGAPDLIRSILVLDDEKGILIAPVLKNGRPDEGMPKLGLTDQQVADLVAWLHVQTYMAGHRTTYAFQDVLTGDAKKGQAYFDATCKGCHSAAGDLKGIGGRYDAFALQAKWLQPRGGRGGGRGGRGADTAAKSEITVTVTPPSGPPITGVLDRVDDFSVSLHDSRGEYHSFTREGATPKVEIHDPLKPHLDLLGKLTDPDIHNVTAYLVTLK